MQSLWLVRLLLWHRLCVLLDDEISCVIVLCRQLVALDFVLLFFFLSFFLAELSVWWGGLKFPQKCITHYTELHQSENDRTRVWVLVCKFPLPFFISIFCHCAGAVGTRYTTKVIRAELAGSALFWGRATAGRRLRVMQVCLRRATQTRFIYKSQRQDERTGGAGVTCLEREGSKSKQTHLVFTGTRVR